MCKHVSFVSLCLVVSISPSADCNDTDHTPQRQSMADKMSPLRLLNKSKEDTLNEINRKMQRALEEALVKNIHLQEVSLVYLCHHSNMELCCIEKFHNKSS